jgi:hypothetical protein
VLLHIDILCYDLKNKTRWWIGTKKLNHLVVCVGEGEALVDMFGKHDSFLTYLAYELRVAFLMGTREMERETRCSHRASKHASVLLLDTISSRRYPHIYVVVSSLNNPVCILYSSYSKPWEVCITIIYEGTEIL